MGLKIFLILRYLITCVSKKKKKVKVDKYQRINPLNSKRDHNINKHSYGFKIMEDQKNKKNK